MDVDFLVVFDFVSFCCIDFVDSPNQGSVGAEHPAPKVDLQTCYKLQAI
jgi:hypothetical protein